jgi:hypothetical protein
MEVVKVMSDLVPRDLTEEALALAAKADLGDPTDDFVIPRLKVAQALTKEVQDGDAEVGELIHSLTGESYGEAVEVIVVDAFKGRAWKDTEGNLHSANREAVVPWEDHPCFGEHFVDCPDAEEQYRARVRANEIDWGKGPGISTTYNFVGLIVREDGEVEEFPVRISLMRAAAKEGRNWQTMLHLARAPWDLVFEVSTVKARSKRGEPYVAVKVKQVRKTTDEERSAAVRVAQALHSSAQVAYDDADADEETEGRAAPAPATGGLDI